MQKILISIIGFFILATSGFVYAEPWLASRYADNCAACHSPGRRNVQTMDRRCTLTCQGCHVNPNGGGLRNEYGNWNSQRWLRSFKVDKFAPKGMPAPLKFQKYSGDHTSADAGKKGKSDKDKKSGTKSIEEMAKNGAALVVVPGVTWDPEDYDAGRDSSIVAKSKTEFLSRVTEDDPYRLERQRSVTAGGDYRYMYFMTGKTEETFDTTPDEYGGAMFPLAFDVGVRIRPIPHKVQLVFEHRHMNSPVPKSDSHFSSQSSFEKVFDGDNSVSQIRSAYIMMDDMALGTFIQYGLYRPMFGLYQADSSSLLNSMLTADNANATGYTYNTISHASAFWVNKALTIGSSNNIPFFNVHMIMPHDGEDAEGGAMAGRYRFAQSSGMAFNFGARLRFMGLYGMFSWWSTEGSRYDGASRSASLKNDMTSITAGMHFNRFGFDVDMTNIDREFRRGESDKGSVTTFDLRYRLWRELYAQASYATSNTSRNLKQGQASEMAYGVRMFILSGLEAEFMMASKEDRDNTAGLTTNRDFTQLQIHAYF